MIIITDSYNYVHEFPKLQISLPQNDAFLEDDMYTWFISPSTLSQDSQRYISRFFHKLRLIVYTKSVRQHVVLRDVPISTTGCRTLCNGYRSSSFAIWFMTGGDRLPSYLRVKEKQFVSASNLMGLNAPWCSYNAQWCKPCLNPEIDIKESTPSLKIIIN